VVDGGTLILFDDDYLGYVGSFSLNLRGSLPNFLNFLFIIFVVLFQGYTMVLGVLGFFPHRGKFWRHVINDSCWDFLSVVSQTFELDSLVYEQDPLTLEVSSVLSWVTTFYFFLILVRKGFHS